MNLSGAITWTEVMALVGIVSYIVATIFWVQGLKKDSDVKIHELESELNDFKQEVAKTYATSEMLHNGLDRVISALNKLTERIDAILMGKNHG